jgi:hypothetical protein
MKLYTMTTKGNRRPNMTQVSMVVAAFVSTSLSTTFAFVPIQQIHQQKVVTTDGRNLRTTQSTVPLVSSNWKSSISFGKVASITIPYSSRPSNRKDAKLPIRESVRIDGVKTTLSRSQWPKPMTFGEFLPILTMGVTAAPVIGFAAVANGAELVSALTPVRFQQTILTENVIGNALNPIIEGEIFSGLAHVALDLLTLTGPATIIVRLGAVIGRMFAMAADYVPDHDVLPLELVFQCLMLCVAWFGLVQSLVPVALSKFAYHIKASDVISKDETSKAQRLRDAKAYSSFFKSTGLSWNHFKAISACAFEWISVSPGDVISSNEIHPNVSLNGKSQEDEYVYWLYNGTVEIQSQGKLLQDIKQSSRQGSTCNMDNPGCGMLFENRLLKRIVEKDSTNTNTSTKWKRAKDSPDSESAKEKKTKSDPQMTIIASGSSNSILLRINTSNLLMLMETDPQLSNSIRTLLMNSMQAKLNAQFVGWAVNCFGFHNSNNTISSNNAKFLVQENS